MPWARSTRRPLESTLPPRRLLRKAAHPTSINPCFLELECNACPSEPFIREGALFSSTKNRLYERRTIPGLHPFSLMPPTPKRLNIRSALNPIHGIHLLFDPPFIKTQLRKQFMRFICNEISQRIHLPANTVSRQMQSSISSFRTKMVLTTKLKHIQILTTVKTWHRANFEKFLAIRRHKACESQHCH